MVLKNVNDFSWLILKDFWRMRKYIIINANLFVLFFLAFGVKKECKKEFSELMVITYKINDSRDIRVIDSRD